MMEPCGCCGRPQPAEWLRRDPPCDAFPDGRWLCGSCFTYHLGEKHSAVQPGDLARPGSGLPGRYGDW
jgi:hypothetical protein